MLHVESGHQHDMQSIQCKEPEAAAGDAHVVGQSSPRLPHQTACEEANEPSREELSDLRQP